METVVALVAVGAALLLFIWWLGRAASTHGKENTAVLGLDEASSEVPSGREFEKIARRVVREEISQLNTKIARLVRVLDRLGELADNRRRLARRAAYSVVGFPTLFGVLGWMDTVNEIRERLGLGNFELIALGTLFAVAGVAVATVRWARDFDDILAGSGEATGQDGRDGHGSGRSRQ